MSAIPRSIARLLLAPALACVLGLVIQPRLCSADTLAKITDAWKSRIEKIHSAEFRLHRIDHIGTGYLNDADSRNPNHVKRNVPEFDTDASARELILIKGACLRYEFDGQAWFIGSNWIGLVDRKVTDILNGYETRTLLRMALDKPVMQGNIQSDYAVGLARGYAPLLWFLGDHGPDMSNKNWARVDPDHKPDSTDPELAHPVLIQTEPWSNWLDADRDYVPVRYFGAPGWQIDVEYERNEEIGWIP